MLRENGFFTNVLQIKNKMYSQNLYMGSHYTEAELSGKGAHVGVTYKHTGCKGEQSISYINRDSVFPGYIWSCEAD